MAAKKTNKQLPSQPNQSDQPKQTLLSIKPRTASEPKTESPTPPPALANEPVPSALDEQVTEKVTAKPKPIKRVLTLPTPTKPVQEVDLSSLPTVTPTEVSQEADEPPALSNAIFQAVGIIPGIVAFTKEGKGTVTIENKEYPLYYSPSHRKAFDALKLQVKKNPGKLERLIVYPQVMHFPKREQNYQLSFQLLGFESPKTTEGLTKELEDFEFRLCGLWQFIPVCQIPCISVFKNFNQERLEYIKQAEPDRKVRFMKASHVPLLWRDAPVRPFRFNPKLDKEQQGQSTFVEVLAKFLPSGSVFGFIRMMGEPGLPPKFLKAGKKDKAEALKIKTALIKQKGQKSPAKKQVWGKPKKNDS